MKRWGWAALACAVFGATATSSPAAGAQKVLLKGDIVKVRLNSPLRSSSLGSGDSVQVTVDETLRTSPKARPILDKGAPASIVLAPLPGRPSEACFRVESVTLWDGGAAHAARVALADSTSGRIPIESPGLFKKLLLPPLFGLLIWRDHGELPAGTVLGLEMRQTLKWEVR